MSGFRFSFLLVCLLAPSLSIAQQFNPLGKTVGMCPGDPNTIWILPPQLSTCNPPTRFSIKAKGVGGPDAVTNPNGCTIGSMTDPFSLVWSDDPPVALVMVNTANLFSTDPTDRQNLFQAFQDFRKALIALESAGNCLAPGGAAFIAERVARGLPLLPEETLPYYYGYNLAGLYVDLRAGMRLKVMNAGFFNQDSTTAPSTMAYTGNGMAHLYVSTQPGTTNLTFSPFMGPLGLGVDLTNITPGVRLAATALDLVSTQTGTEQVPYLRLFYPRINIPAIDTPSLQPANNPLIARANTLDEMDTLTNDLLTTSPNQVCTQAPIPQGTCVIFYGRAALIPEIQIILNGNQVFVPLGTTLRNLLEVQRDWYTPATVPSLILNQLLRRDNGEDGTFATVNFTDETPGSTSFEIPLVAGDIISYGIVSTTGGGLE